MALFLVLAVLSNSSTSAHAPPIQGGANDVIAGFIISGTGSQKVVIRGTGLAAGVNPMLTVQKFPSGEAVASNNDWQVQTAPSSAIPAQFAMQESTNAAVDFTRRRLYCYHEFCWGKGFRID